MERFMVEKLTHEGPEVKYREMRLKKDLICEAESIAPAPVAVGSQTGFTAS